MNELTHDELRGLLAAYALDVLPEDEARAVTRHLRQCASCRADLAAFRQVADDLPFVVPDASPDPALKSQLMARIHKEHKAVVSQPVAGMWPNIAAALRGWRPAVVALALLLIASVLLLWQQGIIDPGPTEREFELSATGVAPEAQGVIRIGTQARTATLTVEGLPPLAAGRQYQLWLIDGEERVSGGVFSVAGDGRASITVTAPKPVDDYTAYGITIEPAGGSPGPTGERVLGYNL